MAGLTLTQGPKVETGGYYHFEEMQVAFNPEALIAPVFTTEIEQTSFVKALSEMKNSGGNIRVGGRTLREAMGCTIVDYTNGISTEKYTQEEEKLLGPLVEMLRRYPEEIMRKPDLDLYFEGLEASDIKYILNQAGLNAIIKKATGNIDIVVVKGSGGDATFVKISDSWQQSTEAFWPKLAIKADFALTPVPQFIVDSCNGSFYLYPLITTMDDRSGPLEPRRFATISRILLWFLTVKDPEGNWLKTPDKHTQNMIFKSVFFGYKRFRELMSDADFIYYSSSCRDFALAMRVLLLTDWDKMVSEGYPQENLSFIRNVLCSWPPSGMAKAKFGKDYYMNVR